MASRSGRAAIPRHGDHDCSILYHWLAKRTRLKDGDLGIAGRQSGHPSRRCDRHRPRYRSDRVRCNDRPRRHRQAHPFHLPQISTKRSPPPSRDARGAPGRQPAPRRRPHTLTWHLERMRACARRVPMNSAVGRQCELPARFTIRYARAHSVSSARYWAHAGRDRLLLSGRGDGHSGCDPYRHA